MCKIMLNFCIVFNWCLVLQHKHKASLAYHDIKRDGNVPFLFHLSFIDLKLSSFYAFVYRKEITLRSCIVQ